ncbi:O-antigen ligase family protein [Odoribacter splanchnicus]|jgi:tetratricopeptide (TPR) repeat protein|uniref:O-antigen ligase family protein n=1 Tax=Odoribacter splanchnicus TaxID=28118 RepID=UPI000E4B4452|nr:O-antigen ligase family protein [Odoribacter splanchnicus]RHA76163.1 hypothetical protein DW919_12440 [Odoribacter splanchnicus]RHL84047.1 hypothetical protein DWZ99_08395 [Odoribacter splanchnicus]
MADGKINRPYGGVLLLGIFLTPLLSLGHDYADGIITAKYFRFAEVVGIGLLLTWMVVWKRNFQFCFRWVDVGVVLFALYGVGSFLLNDFRGETQTLLLILLVGLYFVCRGLGGWKVSQRLLFTFVLLLAGSIEAIWGFLQVYGWADQYHSLYRLTGSFFNPGPYSGFLAVILPVALHTLLGPKPLCRVDKIVYGLGVICLVSIILVLPAGMSRSAWVAAGAGCGVVVWRQKRSREYVRRGIGRIGRGWKRCWLGGILLLGLSIGGGLYLLKKDSADGRLLVWKMDLAVMRSQPWLGVGIGRYPGALGEAQAVYFANSPADPREEYVADAPEYGFNEFLQLGGEYGLIGLCLFLSITGIASGGLFKRNTQQTGGVSGALSAFLVFACFSYPLHMLPMAMLFVLLLAWSVNVGAKGVRIRRWAGQILWLPVMVLGLVAAWRLTEKETAYKTWKTARAYFRQGDYQEALNRYTPLFSALSDRPAFVFEFGECQFQNAQYGNATAIFLWAAELSADPMVYNKLGKNYQALKQYDRAEKAYVQAAHMIPHRIYPLYLLALLYREMGDMEKARDMARQVIDQEPKVWSPAVEEMKTEMKQL